MKVGIGKLANVRERGPRCVVAVPGATGVAPTASAKVPRVCERCMRVGAVVRGVEQVFVEQKALELQQH